MEQVPAMALLRPAVRAAAPTAPHAVRAGVAAQTAHGAASRQARWACAFAAGGLWRVKGRASKGQRKALELSDVNVLEQVQQFWHHVHGPDAVPAAELAAALQQWADNLSQGAGHLAHELVPPAYAADIELDPNTTYLYGADGAVLVDPMNNKPITDDWWNGFIGFQSEIIKAVDNILREKGRVLKQWLDSLDLGVEQAFGWTIVLYTAFIKVLFFPLQQASKLRGTNAA